MNKINKDIVDVYMHLWYLEPSKRLMQKISKIHTGEVFISLNKGGVNNEEIIDFANKLFEKVNITTTDNSGSDQLGFWRAYKKEKNRRKPYTLYIHDKREDKQDWVDDLVDPIIDNIEEINDILERKENVAGIISSKKRRTKIHTEDALVEIDQISDLCSKKGIVLSRHTLVWLRELQYILFNEHAIIDKDAINFDFSAGTMFIANSQVIEYCHECVHPTFFGDCYRTDGNVEHAMERFYYYVSLCLKYENIFI